MSCGWGGSVVKSTVKVFTDHTQGCRSTDFPHMDKQFDTLLLKNCLCLKYTPQLKGHADATLLNSIWTSPGLLKMITPTVCFYWGLLYLDNSKREFCFTM